MIQPEDFDPPEIVRRAFQAGQQGKRLIDALGFEEVVVGAGTDGPCERFMQSVPLIKGLYRAPEAYAIGRALLMIGANIDILKVGTDVARAFVDHLANKIQSFNATASTNHWSAEQTFDLFGSYPLLNGTSLAEADADFWSEIKADLLCNVAGPKEEEADCSYTHPSLAVICDEIVPATRSIHLTPEDYIALEDACWSRLADKDIPRRAQFVLHVDGDRWTPAIDDDEALVRTDYLFAAFDARRGVILEHTSWKGSRSPNLYGRVIGCDFDRGTGLLNWRSSENTLVAGQRVRVEPPKREKERIFRVAIGFLALVRHHSTELTPITGNKLLRDHFNLKPPQSVSIDVAILTVMLRETGR